MTVKDEGVRSEREENEEQARTEGSICCRKRKKGGVCVCVIERLMS